MTKFRIILGTSIVNLVAFVITIYVLCGCSTSKTHCDAYGSSETIKKNESV